MPRTRKPPKPKRRPRGDGSLYQTDRTWTTRDGETRTKRVWVCALREGRVNENGRSRLKRKVFQRDTLAAVRAARDEYLREKGKAVPEEVPETDPTTIEEYAKRFLQHVENTARATTKHSYAITLRMHVIPDIGRVPIRQLSPERIKSMYDALRSKVSPSMVARCHAVLRTMLNLAVEERLIEASPLASIRKAVPRYKRPRIDALSEKEVKSLLKAASGHRLEALIVLAVTTGMRQGELFGLRWTDVDLRRRTLYVRRSAQEVGGEITFVAPKTDSSRRRITLSKIATEAVQRRRTIAKKEGHESALLFPSNAGHVLRKSNFQRREWDPIRTAAGIPHAHFHMLRHTAASLLLIEGTNPKVVQEMLGHSDIRLTLGTYSHVIPTMQAGAADAFDRLLGGSRKRGAKAR